MRIVVATAALAVGLAATALGLPGDPPPAPLTPADGATVAANPQGIPVTFSCPTYRQDVYGDESDPTIDYGTSEDYDVHFSPVASVDEQGVLGNEYYSSASTTADGDTCTTALDTQDGARSPEAVGGTVYWQVSRPCVGCTPQVEAGPVRSFTVTAPKIASRVRTPKHVYAGYLTRVSVTTKSEVSGGRVTLQRKAGRHWKTIETGDAGKTVVFFLKLARGKQRLRAVITTVGGSSAGRVTTVAVRPDSNRTTSRRDDGRYEEASARATVKNGGRTLTGFSTPVTAYCFGATIEDNRFMILFAGIDSAPIAPDGTVTARLQTKSKGAEVQLTGRVRKGHFKGEAFIYVSSSRCSGTRKVDLKRK